MGKTLNTLSTVGADKWGASQFGELNALIQQAKSKSVDLTGSAAQPPLMLLPRTNMPLEILFDKPTSKHVTPYSFDNQLIYELADVEIKKKCQIRVSRELEEVYFPRISGVIALIETFAHLYPSLQNFHFSVALGDLEKNGDSLAFSAAVSPDLLIPDPYFIMTRGYENERKSFPLHPVAWKNRIDKAYWRGALSGFIPEDIKKSPRIATALYAKTYPELFNVAVVGGGGSELLTKLAEWNILGDREPQERILDFKYQIDIDGYSNAWVGFFLKLLTGAPVLKINSESGYRQWYYDKLRPWENYVPVATDLSDLATSVQKLRSDPALAESIGRKGIELALQLTYESQLRVGAETIKNNIRRI